MKSVISKSISGNELLFLTLTDNKSFLHNVQMLDFLLYAAEKVLTSGGAHEKTEPHLKYSSCILSTFIARDYAKLCSATKARLSTFNCVVHFIHKSISKCFT